MIEQDQYVKGLLMKALDAAIAAMSRNRALLFSLNLLSAMVVITVFLERADIDNSQREQYVIALQDIQAEMRSSKVPDSIFTTADPKVIEQWFFSQPKMELSRRKEISKSLYRLRVVRNDMSKVALPADQHLPIGIAVPRNDLVPITALLMVSLYAWLVFSFQQLADIIERLRSVFADKGDDYEGKKQFTDGTLLCQPLISQIIEFHFLFRTSRGGPTRWFVHALYFSPPIAVVLALANDLYSISERTHEWHGVLMELSSGRFMIETACLVALVFIGYHIKLADHAINLRALRESQV